MSNALIIRILSPLIFFVLHVVYLAGWSKDSFFNKWIDGSFSFFLALVMCNVIRSRVVPTTQHDSGSDDTGHDQDGGDSGNTP